jgi:hypothetical protein
MNKFLKDCMTDNDNETYELESLSFFIVILTVLGLTIAQFCFTHDFDAGKLGTCITAISTARGISRGINNYTRKQTGSDQ